MLNREDQRRNSQSGFTLVELLVVIAIIGILVALLLPAVQAAREAARRSQCLNNLKQLSIALHCYLDANKALPPGVISGVPPTVKMDTWAEASSLSPMARGTSWVVATLPYFEEQVLHDQWDYNKNVIQNVVGGVHTAQTDLPTLYCPSRRSTVRNEDIPHMFKNWTRGGNDYGACFGAGNTFLNDAPGPPCTHRLNQTATGEFGSNHEMLGVFTYNRGIKSSEITDGTSSTIMLGEMQRLLGVDHNGNGTICEEWSLDGWAVGGQATGFNTDWGLDPLNPGGINNLYFESAGSDHPGGAHIATCDGSVRYLSEDIDDRVLNYLGSRSSGEVVSLP